MPAHDVVIVGGGISGLSLAHYCRAQGRDVCLLESAERLGGALHSPRIDLGSAQRAPFWLELGGHTGYNSYGRLLEIIDSLGLGGRLLKRETASWLLWRDGRARSIPSQLNWAELALSLPKLPFLKREGRTVADYYGRVLGRRNWRSVLGHMLSAVASQDVSDFPADLLFKKRPRRKDISRSYAIDGGWQGIAEAIAAQEGLTVHTAAYVHRIFRHGASWRVEVEHEHGAHEDFDARTLALAVAPDAAAALLEDSAPEVAGHLGPLQSVALQSEGVVVRADAVRLPRLAGLVGVDVPFRSVVSRDPVADADWRGFAFHFRPGTLPEERTAQITAVLGVKPADIAARVTATRTLPSPHAGHAQRIERIDGALQGMVLAGRPLLLTGNWFGGLAIEDCVNRSAAEAERLAGMP